MKNRTAAGCWGWLAGLGLGLAAHPGAHAAIVAVPDPGIPAELGVRVRNGGTGVEAMIFDNQPSFSTPATLNPPGAPVWTYGHDYPFAAVYNSTTGQLALAVDFNKNGTAGDITSGAGNERMVWVFPEYIGHGFQYLTLAAQGRSSPAAGVTLSQLVFNGTPLGDLASNSDAVVQKSYAQDGSAAPFEQISLTGTLNFSASGGSQERPKMEVRLAGPLPLLGTVPEPAGTLPVLGAAMVLLSRRRPA